MTRIFISGLNTAKFYLTFYSINFYICCLLFQSSKLLFLLLLCSNHFPYFKTAPSGWKNSVRHNLSLNQCFEKIEKPMPNSGSSRKGCLWAMNPDKIAKMDAEVQKWSKKDPMAIKKAMVYPGWLLSILPSIFKWCALNQIAKFCLQSEFSVRKLEIRTKFQILSV